jgi:hypothetical protein
MTKVEKPNATVPDSVEVPRVGALRYELGFPTPETSQKLFDEMDFQRAVQAYLWAYPAVSFESIRLTLKEDLGIDFNDLGIADTFVHPESLWLTANDTTIYAVVNIDVARGPVVIEIPPGAIVGLLDDFWQRSLVDVGLPGPDAGNGGKFLLLPPGYDGDVPSGYYEVRATMHNHNLLVRGIIVDNDVADAVARIRNVKVYPWSERDDPKPNKFTSISGALIDTTPPGGMEYWARLAAVINNNPVQEHDRFYMAMLKPLGIEKGQPFESDARQQAILEDAAVLGDAMARNVMYEGSQRETGVTAFPGTRWDWVFYVTPSQEAENYSQLDERLQYTYGAIYLSPALGVMKAGPGGNYIQAFRDKDGNHFDGSKSYRLRAGEPAGGGLLVTDGRRQRNALHGPEPDERRGPRVLRRARDERRWLVRHVLRAHRAGRPGEQLGRDGSRQGLLPDVPPLQPHRGAVRRYMVTSRRRTDLTSSATRR